MARELGDRVKLGTAVYSIDQTGDLVEVRTVNEEIYKVRMCTKLSMAMSYLARTTSILLTA